MGESTSLPWSFRAIGIGASGALVGRLGLARLRASDALVIWLGLVRRGASGALVGRLARVWLWLWLWLARLRLLGSLCRTRLLLGVVRDEHVEKSRLVLGFVRRVVLRVNQVSRLVISRFPVNPFDK